MELVGAESTSFNEDMPWWSSCTIFCPQVHEHDHAPLAGNGVAIDLQVVDNRVFALELFGTLTLYDVVWMPGYRHAAMTPLATQRDSAWVRAFAPIDRWSVAAAVHAHSMAVLHLDESRLEDRQDEVEGACTSATLLESFEQGPVCQCSTNLNVTSAGLCLPMRIFMAVQFHVALQCASAVAASHSQ